MAVMLAVPSDVTGPTCSWLLGVMESHHPGLEVTCEAVAETLDSNLTSCSEPHVTATSFP